MKRNIMDEIWNNLYKIIKIAFHTLEYELFKRSKFYMSFKYK